MNHFFGPDKVNTSELADLILSQPLIGSTIKTDDDDDALAIFTVLNINVHDDKPCIRQIKDYILSNASKNPEFQKVASTLFRPDSPQHIGLLLNERLINMPVQLIPPMYKMLSEELQWAIDDKEPYNFEYFLLLSKTYREVAPQETAEGGQSEIPQKKSRAIPIQESQYVNMEDSIVANFCESQITLDFRPPSVADSKRAFSDFGIIPGRKASLIHKSQFKNVIDALDKAIPPP
ncbi:Mss4p nuclear export [Entomophthora muscae]|uniref:Mss4p nuclear export n=1 Tax=Entomophthora muscae TaxID=34485 RepID=A0ACC2RGN3_9FUNG|nr:Mss4p nuclear export [Entomophthora muscae]